jgi:hypothetical protein
MTGAYETGDTDGDKVKLDAYDTEPSAQLGEEEAKERLLS